MCVCAWFDRASIFIFVIYVLVFNVFLCDNLNVFDSFMCFVMLSVFHNAVGGLFITPKV